MTKESSNKFYANIDINTFHKSLLIWGRANYQNFPWRTFTDPYKILVAEIMLHRTKAKQVVPIYLDFIKRFPEIKSINSSNQIIIYSLFYPLGLRWRSKLFVEMCQIINDKCNSNIPSDKQLLVSLPGVSEYIACAVRCFAWKFPEALIDTNTVRIIARLNNIEITDSLRRRKDFMKLLSELIYISEPDAYNFALIDLAHLICLPKNPNCPNCPIKTICLYNQNHCLIENS